MATSTGGTAVSQAQAVAKSVCDCLKTGTGVAEAVATAASSGNAQTAAQAIAEAVSGGALIRHMVSTKAPKQQTVLALLWTVYQVQDVCL